MQIHTMREPPVLWNGGRYINEMRPRILLIWCQNFLQSNNKNGFQ